MSPLAFRSSNSKNDSAPQKWRDANPFILIGRTYLLVDDAIHRGVNKTAEKIENSKVGKKLGLTKIIQARVLLTIGYSEWICSDIVKYGVNINKIKVLGFIGGYLIYNHLISGFARIKITDSLIAKNPVDVLIDMYNKTMRFILFATGTFCTVFNTARFELQSLLDSLSFVAIGSGVHLASSSNGMLDRFKDKVSEILKAFEPVTAPIPQTVEVKN